VTAVGERFRAGLEGIAPGLARAGDRLLSRISTPNWALEWSLPVWLGEAFGIPADVSEGLVLANAYGLGFVRLVDGMVDGEDLGFETREAASLAVALYRLWTAQCCEVVCGVEQPAALNFWERFAGFLSAWLEVSLDGSLPRVPFRAYAEPDFRRLAARGAPLKVCCAAACFLSGRERDLPALEDAIDQLLVGAVLLDHALDWREDLAAERANAFIAYASALPQTAENRDENRRRVVEAMLSRHGARSYFARISVRLRAARRTARMLRCTGLLAFLRWLDCESEAYAAGMRDEAQARLDWALRTFADAPSQINGRKSGRVSYGDPGTT
jgi:hypothetical protein